MVDEFDQFADKYDESLQLGLDLTGEDKDFYISQRVAWVRRRWEQWPDKRNFASSDRCKILDFGCGTGGTSPYLLKTFSSATVVGVDTSLESLHQAQRLYAQDNCHFYATSQLPPQQNFSLVYCNGVFHHIAPHAQVEVVQWIYEQMLPGGWFCLWENNPWNPGTRWVMNRIPFDRDAIMLSAIKTRRLLTQCRFQILATDYCFYFPRFLAPFRRFEPWLCRMPLGGQYCVIARKSGDPT